MTSAPEVQPEVARLAERLRVAISRNSQGLPPSELGVLLRRELSVLDVEVRGQLVDSIVSACAPELEAGENTSLFRNLRLVRDALREPFPGAGASGDEACGLQLDELLAIDERTFWIRGWIDDIGGALGGLTMLSPEGSRAEILPGMFRHHRPDTESSNPGRSGFVSLFELDVPSRLSDGWITEVRYRDGAGAELEAPPVNRAELEVAELITRALRDVSGDKHEFVSRLAHPALSRVQARIQRSVAIEIVAGWGELARAPDVSILVPLGDRLDALEHQLCQFSGDSDVAGSELIYVLDSLQDAHELAPKAAELHMIYEVPFRLAALSGSAGTTIMLNKAASLARAPKLLLLSPDVVPDSRGWLGAMLAFYDSRQDIGALGPMLLYEDGSVQHAGLRLAPASPQESGLLQQGDDRVLEPRSRFKGLPGTLAEVNEAASVTAISGACLMVDRALFEAAGGLRNAYAEGQFEDADLGLRLLDAGKLNWYLPDVRMYYLEGRSELEPSRHARQYNALLLSHLWGDRAAGSKSG